MRHFLWLAVVAGSTVTAGAQSPTLKQCDINGECARPFSRAELSGCIADIRDREDRRLNAVYGDLIAEIKRSDHPNPDGVVAVLRKSQRAWVAYREAYCGFRLEFSDPIVAGLMATSCECTLTRDKADHLSDD